MIASSSLRKYILQSFLPFLQSYIHPSAAVLQVPVSTMASPQSTKSGVVTEMNTQYEGYEMASRSKYSGTENDVRDMRMLGRTQQLNVGRPTSII